MSALGLAAGLVLIAAVCTAGGSEEGGSIGVASNFNVASFLRGERDPAPAFSGETLRDRRRLDDGFIRGKVAVVNFWGSWCGPCRDEQPALEALWKEYGPRDVAFLGINTRRDQEAAALAYLEEFAVTYPSIYDPPSRIAFDFGVRVMPATFVIDRDGMIAAQIFGALRDEADLRRILDAELTT